MTNSFTYGLITASFGVVLMAAAMSPSAKVNARVIPGRNTSTFAAACDRSKTCISWGGGVFTNGGTGGVICNDKKCVKVPDDTPARTGSNDNRSNDPSGSTMATGGGKGDAASGAGGNPSSMSGDSGPSID